MRKYYYLLIFVFIFFSVSACRIEPPTPDLSPPTSLEVTDSTIDPATRLNFNWFLIRDDNENAYEGVNIYFVKKTDVDDDIEQAKEYLKQQWANHKIDKDNIEACCIVQKDTDDVDNKYPTFETNYYDDSGGKINNIVKISQIPDAADFSTDKYFFAVTSVGSWNDGSIILESPLSNVVGME